MNTFTLSAAPLKIKSFVKYDLMVHGEPEEVKGPDNTVFIGA